MRYDPMIKNIVLHLAHSDAFLREELRAEMHMALPGLPCGDIDDRVMEKILTVVAEAYMHGRR